MLAETFWWRLNFQTGSQTLPDFSLYKSVLNSIIIFSIHLSNLRVNWDMIDANGNMVSEHLNFIFPLAKTPSLAESLCCSCWMLPTDLFFGICQSPGGGEEF